MLVIFSAFIVYKNGRKRRASMTEDSINVWPVNKSKDMNPDYHGRFTAEEFEQLFENLCKSLIHYGNCIIHIDGASYHKHRINPVPSSADRKDKIVEWLVTKGYLETKEDELSSGLTKNELLDIVKIKHLTPVYESYDIARKYNYNLMFTPPYRCELQPIEKVWSMVKSSALYSFIVLLEKNNIYSRE